MFQQDKGDRAAQARLSDWITRNDLRFCARESVLPDSFLDDRTDLVPGTSDLADDDDHVWRESRNERRDSPSQVVRHLPQSIDCLAVALFGKPQQMIKTDRLFSDVGASSTTA